MWYDRCSVNMFFHFGLVILVCQVIAGLSSPTSYDQRQTGDVNVQIHLKDVQVVALLDSELLDDYTDYDYFYDYADFTVKPIVKPTTSTTTTVKPLNASSTDVSSETTEKVDATNTLLNVSSQNTTISTPISESLNENTTNELPSMLDNNKTDVISTTNSIDDANNSTADTLSSSVIDKVDDVSENYSNNITTESTNVVSSTKIALRRSEKRCRSGYSPDGSGRCRRLHRRRVSLIPLALKLAPKFLEDLSYTAKNSPQ